jgi:uncharacterized protein (TIGR02300 family)
MSDSFNRAKTARGTKQRCDACEQPFYDLSRSPIVCPYCGNKLKRTAARSDSAKSARATVRQSGAGQPAAPPPQDDVSEKAAGDVPSDEPAATEPDDEQFEALLDQDDDVDKSQTMRSDADE